MAEIYIEEKSISVAPGKEISLFLLVEAELQKLSKEERLLLHPHYLGKIDAMKREEGKHHALAGGYLLWKVLGVTPEDVLVLGEQGKPYFPHLPKEFSLSHDNGVTVLAVSSEPVGVDIEHLTETDLRVVQKVFPKAFQDKVVASGGTAESFTECWTKLEAILKAEGCGFHGALKDNEEYLQKWQVCTFPWKDFFISVAYPLEPNLT